jgi:hypothetical protein
MVNEDGRQISLDGRKREGIKEEKKKGKQIKHYYYKDYCSALIKIIISS